MATPTWKPHTDPEWDRIPTPAGERFRRTTPAPETGLYPEVIKSRGSRTGVWYHGSAYDAATGLNRGSTSGKPQEGWDWAKAQSAAVAAAGGQ